MCINTFSSVQRQLVNSQRSRQGKFRLLKHIIQRRFIANLHYSGLNSNLNPSCWLVGCYYVWLFPICPFSSLKFVPYDAAPQLPPGGPACPRTVWETWDPLPGENNVAGHRRRYQVSPVMTASHYLPPWWDTLRLSKAKKYSLFYFFMFSPVSFK